MVRNTDDEGGQRLSRRRYVALGTIAMAGVAGCTGGETEASTGSGSELATPEATVEALYETLFQENDVEAANELYHPDSESPRIERADFEEFGGLEVMSASVLSTETVSEDGEITEIHAEINYTVPAGSAQNTDYLFLRQSDGQWLLDRWLPEAVRRQG